MSQPVDLYFGSKYPSCSTEINETDWTSPIYGLANFIDKEAYDDLKLFAKTSELASKYVGEEGALATLFANGGKASGTAWPIFSLWCTPKILCDAAYQWSKVSFSELREEDNARASIALAKACKKTISAVGLCFYSASLLAGWAALESSQFRFYGDIFDTIDKTWDLKNALFSALTSRAAVLEIGDVEDPIREVESDDADQGVKNYQIVNQNFNYHMLKAGKAICSIATFALAILSSYWNIKLVSQVALLVISLVGTLSGTAANFYAEACMDIKPVNLHYELPG